MLLAGKRANALGIPVVLDPVAAGVTSLRREAVGRLLSEVRFAVIRGNASEIRALALGQGGGSGVDVAAGDEVTEGTLPAAAELTRSLARRTGAAIALSGAVDVLSDGETVLFLRNGVPTMARITGSGCMLTALTGAFCGASPENPFEAAAAAMAALGVAGEVAEERRLQNGTGNATSVSYTHLVTEGILAGVLSTIWLTGCEGVWRTGGQLCVTRTGRKLWRVKLLAALGADLLLYAPVSYTHL